MLRLFVGIKIPNNICEQLYTLRGGIFGARWTPKENYHLTLRFIGEVDERAAEDVDIKLSGINSPAFDLSLCQIGYFTKNKNEIRTLWTGVDNYHVLDHLHEKIDSAVIRAGQPPSSTKFHAHCTIAKMKGATLDEVQKYVAMNNLFRSQRFRVDEFHLFSSIRSMKGGATSYQPLTTYQLYEPIQPL